MAQHHALAARRTVIKAAVLTALGWRLNTIAAQGNLYGAGPEAVYVFAPDGTHLGSVFTGVPTGNLTWGDDDATLFITAGTQLLRLRATTIGAGF